MKKAVMYGAGNIGRGFIGQLFSKSGYEVCFIDVNETAVNELNRRGEYPVRILTPDKGHTDEIVKNVRAVNGRDIDAVTKEILEADLMATAVGVNVLPLIAEPLALGLSLRFHSGGKPLDIIICENKLEADQYLRELIGERMSPEVKAWFVQNIGLVEASIGRMVPLQTDEMRDGDFLRVCVEEYAELPVDREAFKAGVPAVVNMQPDSPFSFYIERKLFIHNMGHAMTAFLGKQKGYTYIWEAIGDSTIKEPVYMAMTQSGRALCKKHQKDFYEVSLHIEDLIKRFGNRRLGDTVERVGSDLPRKLSDNDRMFGAARMCEEQGVENTYILKGIAAALQLEYNDKSFTIKQLKQQAQDAVYSK